MIFGAPCRTRIRCRIREGQNQLRDAGPRLQNFFRGPGYKLGAFAGYNYYRENKSAYGCSQIANPLSDCVPAISSSVLVITEDDTWK